ncbi:CoA transferase [Microbacterium sp. USHLN186]|uniref:CoA transferase n=1 Tax=Microbacterium sp. USHLN186 TaxID=3081286 RepID=UPI003019C3E8
MTQSLGGHPVPLPSTLGVAELARRSVHAAGAALSVDGSSSPDPDDIAAAYRSDRYLRIDGAAPDVWSPLSRFWPTTEGWIRTHGNYPHHAVALRVGLGLPADADAEEIGSVIRTRSVVDAVGAIRAAGGMCAPALGEHPERDAELRARPLVETSPLTTSALRQPVRRLSAGSLAAPLAGVRVLDLTRVIAGPVATRTLALAGAEVLRIDPPWLPEPDWQHLDTGHGKRSALLDIAAEPQRFERVLTGADVVVLGYRPEALAGLGLSAPLLAERHPHLIVGQLSAWPGADSPRGFDSLVQAESGISWLESPDGQEPGALPAQALDHSAGYLLAAGIATALRRRTRSGGGWWVRTSLRRVAAELLGMPRGIRPAEPTAPPARTQDFVVAGRRITTVAPAVRWPGSPEWFPAPRVWGGDDAAW